MISSIPDSCLQSWFPRAEFHLASLSPFPPVPPLQIGCRFLVSWQPTSPSPLSIPLHHPLIPPSPSPLAPTPPRLPRLTLPQPCPRNQIKSRQKVRPSLLLDALRPAKIQFLLLLFRGDAVVTRFHVGIFRGIQGRSRAVPLSE